MVSAVKKGGVPLYKLARKGIEVEREPRLVHIYNFRFTTYEEPFGSLPARLHQGHLRAHAWPMTWARNSAAGRTSRRCGGSPPGNSMSPTRCSSRMSMNYSVRELEERVIPFLKLSRA